MDYSLSSPPQPGNSDPRLPRRTRPESNNYTDQTPKPTTAPDLAAGSANFQGLQENQDKSTKVNTWLNSQTCGWFNGTSSLPLTCEKPWSCVTDEGVVACHLYAWTILHSACLDYQAQQLGKCTSLGGLTGCCSSAEYPACMTYLWTEPPPRSRLACGETSTVIYMNDRPQFVIDAEHTPTSLPPTGPDSSTTPTADSVPTTADPTIPPKASSGPSSLVTGNLAAVIVGAAIGALFIMAVLIAVIVWLCLRNRRRHHRTTSRRGDHDTARAYELQVMQAPNRTTPRQATSATTPGSPSDHTHYTHQPGPDL